MYFVIGDLKLYDCKFDGDVGCIDDWVEVLNVSCNVIIFVFEIFSFVEL